MRIIIAGSVYYPAMNGQAIFTESLTEGLARNGHQVLSIIPSETGKPYSAVKNNVRLEAMPALNFNQLHPDTYLSLFALERVREVMLSFRPEVVHIQDHYPLSRAALKVARELGVPVIGTNHFMPENLAAFVPFSAHLKPFYNRLMWNWMLDLYNRLDLVTAQSRASASLLRKQGLKPAAFPVSCGINLSRFHPDPTIDRAAIRQRYGIHPDKKVILFVGRVDFEKRVDVLLQAMASLQREDVQLVIAGKGSAADALKQMAADLRLGNPEVRRGSSVHFPGFIPAQDLPALLNSADIFTMPSEAELLSIATLEAMACGKPVLLANAVALPELVSQGKNGYTFEPGNPSDAARCINALADHPERWNLMGQLSREKAQYHSLENALKQYTALYTSLLHESSIIAGTDNTPSSPKKRWAFLHQKK